MENKLQEFRELLNEFDHGMLTTQTSDGHLSTRPMVLQDPRPERALWMVSSTETSSVENIEKNPQVNLSFGRSSDKAWISVAAKATLNKNKRLIQELWDSSWDIWFKDESQHSSAVLIELEPVQIDFWEPDKGALGRMFELAKSKMSDSSPDLAPVRTLRISDTELAAAMSGGAR
jgi:general stress protein 26